MDASAGKYTRNESENNRKRMNPNLRFSSRFKTEEKHQRLLNETIERNETPSGTALYDIPLEMLDIVLQKTYLHWVSNSSKEYRDEEVIGSLMSVDVCFNRRITRQRFKKAIWRYLKDFYGKTKRSYAIIRNNRNYLLENIEPNNDFIALLLSFNCVTEEQSHFIQRQHSNRDRSAELLNILEPFDETKFSNVVKCLRQTNQETVAWIIENGGGVIKIEVQTRGAKSTTSMEPQLLHQNIEDLRNRIKPRSQQTDKFISQLREEGIEILNSQLDRRTVVVWIWCHLQSGLEHVQSLYESNQLKDVFFENIQPSISKVISIDRNQFQKLIVMCPSFITFTQKLELHGIEYVHRLTKLRNEIYVLCRSACYHGYVIHVFEDRNQFRLQEHIEIKHIKRPVDIVSSEKENCLYVSDSEGLCIWKITRQTDDKPKIIKWLTTKDGPRNLSMCSDGHLVVNDFTSTLNIYGSNAELIRSIQLPAGVRNSLHAVETSIGNIVVVHNTNQISEFSYIFDQRTKNIRTEMVIRRFIPSNETQELKHPFYLLLDSDDRVFVADKGNYNVILLNSNLKWNRILCPTKEEQGVTKIGRPQSLCYDKEKKQLIVGDHYGVNVYTCFFVHQKKEKE